MLRKMTKMCSLVFVFVFFVISCGEERKEIINKKEQGRLTSYVDPFIGTGGHGHTFPGASVPFGMVQVSPDNGKSGWDWCSGYNYTDSIVAGFSQLHLSGTGIGDLADILLMPVDKKIDLTAGVKERGDIPYKSNYSHSSEKASPGYYSVYLEDPEIDVELTASKRTAFHRYTFREGDQQSVVIDLGFSINWDKPTRTKISVENNTVTGYRFSTGWAKNQKVFFIAEFSKPISSYDLYAEGQKKTSSTTEGQNSAVQLFFDPSNSSVLNVKLALSSVSIENARENLQSTSEANFEEAKMDAKKEWENALGDIQVETPVDSLKKIFYTALYHTQLSPVTFSDVNGEFRLGNDSIKKAKDFTAYSTLSLWDTFRAEQPLLTLIEPHRVSDIISSMLEYYQVNSSLPVWNLYGNETNTMTGYHSIPVIAEAYFKGIRDFDVEKAYEAMKQTMMQNARGLKFYKEYGYVPYDKMDESVTISLEYAYDDWCVAQMAKALGKEEDYQYFLKRSKAYQKVYDPETGFMRGKSSDGKSWHEPFDPKFSRHREKTDYTEGNAWQHSWFVLHDTDDFIKLHGGKENFTRQLEQLFSESSEIKGENASADISGLIGQYAHGNEPSHHIAYLFNRAGEPWRTQYWVRKILSTQYNTSPNGLSGNEDAGQMSAWYVFSSIGLYPFNPASAEYEIGSPVFEKTTINLPNGKKFHIIAENVSDKNIYIQSATLNGEEFNRTSISHEQILKGGKLIFQMGAQPNKNWGVNSNEGR